MILILGGTAAYHLNLETDLPAVQPVERLELDTPYGRAFPIFRLQPESPPWPEGVQLAFASRHGVHGLDVSPPFVNTRANLWAAHHLGVQAILGWNGVGAINPLLELHDVLVLDGVLDYTRTRPHSFAEPSPSPSPSHPPAPTSIWHVPHDAPATPVPAPAAPFDPALRHALAAAARAATTRAFSCGVYACSEGPRLETAAEIRLFRQMGADVVGMTLVPEVLLAHELGIAYGSLTYVTNYATGVEPASDAPRHFGVEVARFCLNIVFAAALGVAGSKNAQNAAPTYPMPC